MNEQKQNPKLCAWCLNEGVETIIGWTSCEGENGICDRHIKEERDRAVRISALFCQDVAGQSESC